MSFPEELKELAWQAAQVVKNCDPDRLRKDACGAWIVYDDFNDLGSMFGWEIDHIYPVFRLKRLDVSETLWDKPLNIRALNWKNNRSKGVSYPIYTAVMTCEGDINVEMPATFLVNEALQDSLCGLFKIKE